ncbi:MAG: aldehyde dehydrogenase family protein [Planktomarina sp.]
MQNAKKFYINGAWVAPLDGRDHAVIDPSTEDPFATISLGGAADTDAAVAAAKAALPVWRMSSKAERLDLLRSILDVYIKHSDDMGALMSAEMGAPIDYAKRNQAGCGDYHIKGFIEALEDFEFEQPYRGHPEDWIIHDPIGVCALITPWNWPINQIALKVIPALAAGCTMVLKPSEESPLSAVLWSEIMHQAGVPAGVYNMLQGDGAGVGSQLSAHKDVDMVSFTGSTRAGRLITKAGADTIKRVALELGGKGANIIFADADEKAIKRGVIHCMNNTGQSCNAPTRMLVERSRYDAAVEEAAKVAATITPRPASETGRNIGPVVNAVQFDKIQDMIQAGLDEGARLIEGGLGRPDGLNRGYFVRPTIFADCTPDMRVMREEIFGPVLCMMPFDSEEEAIAIANDTEYGLTNYVQTSDPAKAHRAARAMQSGMVEINGKDRSNGAPFGGVKQSGNGREGGIWGIHDFLEVKAIGGWPAS